MKNVMKRVVIVALSLVVWGCGSGDSTEVTDGKGDEKKGKYFIDPDFKKMEPADEVEKTDEKVGDPRQALLEKEWGLYKDKVLTHSAADLTQDEKEMLRHLLKAAALIEDLHMLQLHPRNLEWEKQINTSGTEVEKKIFTRFQNPWCADNESRECCALAEKPEKQIGHMHWPNDMLDPEYKALSKQINGRELISPFTVVSRNKDSKLEAVPFSQTDVLGPKMKEVARELRAAASSATHKSLKKFLLSRADALEADEPYPYDDSDYDWIAVKGDWEVTVGPYETYKNPYQLKALFEMYIGRVDKKITGELVKFKANLQAMENALGELVGTEIYKSRKLDPRISIRAVDIWMASGDGRRDRGATVAFHLPNRGKSVDEGLYKKVMMVNHSMAFEGVSKARADLVLDESQIKYVNAKADITNVTFHEFAHGFGAYHEMKVKNPKGKETTVKEALKEYDSLLEEEKADTFGLWLLSFQKRNGWVDEEQEMVRYTSALMHILGLLQYPLNGVYPRMVAIQLGWYLDAGAVNWDEKTGRFTMNYEKMPAAVESLAKKVATIQLTGDYDQAKELIGKYIVSKGEKDYELKGVLAQARKVMMDKFEKAGIKSPSLRYEVTDL